MSQKTFFLKIQEIRDRKAYGTNDFGAPIAVPMSVSPYKGAPPKVGETWLIENNSGVWRFAGIINPPDPPVITGERIGGTALDQLLYALDDSGLIVNETIEGQLPPDIDQNTNAASAVPVFYKSLTGKGETVSPGDLTQAGGFTINDTTGDGITLNEIGNGDIQLNTAGNGSIKLSETGSGSIALASSGTSGQGIDLTDSTPGTFKTSGAGSITLAGTNQASTCVLTFTVGGAGGTAHGTYVGGGVNVGDKILAISGGVTISGSLYIASASGGNFTTWNPYATVTMAGSHQATTCILTFTTGGIGGTAIGTYSGPAPYGQIYALSGGATVTGTINVATTASGGISLTESGQGSIQIRNAGTAGEVYISNTGDEGISITNQGRYGIAISDGSAGGITLATFTNSQSSIEITDSAGGGVTITGYKPGPGGNAIELSAPNAGISILTNLGQITIQSSGGNVEIIADPIGGGGILLSCSKIGFLGASAITAPSHVGVTTVAQLVTILQNYGLLA